MNDLDVIRSYSNETLYGIVHTLSKSGQWPTRLQTAKNEIARRYQKNEIVEYHPLPLSAPPESARSIS